jgi:lysozyme
MQTSEQGLTLIKNFEGFSAKPYICPAGKSTIGYGHVIAAGEQFPGGEIDLNMEEILLKQDVIQREQAINCLIQVTLLQYQFDALISFVYNIGIQAFDK